MGSPAMSFRDLRSEEPSRGGERGLGRAGSGAGRDAAAPGLAPPSRLPRLAGACRAAPAALGASGSRFSLRFCPVVSLKEAELEGEGCLGCYQGLRRGLRESLLQGWNLSLNRLAGCAFNTAC